MPSSLENTRHNHFICAQEYLQAATFNQKGMLVKNRTFKLSDTSKSKIIKHAAKVLFTRAAIGYIAQKPQTD